MIVDSVSYERVKLAWKKNWKGNRRSGNSEYWLEKAGKIEYYNLTGRAWSCWLGSCFRRSCEGCSDMCDKKILL